MSQAKKLVLLFLLLSALLSGFLGSYVAVHVYREELDTLVVQAQLGALDRPGLQLAIYRRDEQALGRFLADFLQPEAAAAAAVFDSVGTVLLSDSMQEVAPRDPPNFFKLRQDAPDTDAVLVALDESEKRSDPGFWPVLFGGPASLHITVPVLAGVNPLERGLQPADFVAVDGPALTSTFVVGTFTWRSIAQWFWRAPAPPVAACLR